MAVIKHIKKSTVQKKQPEKRMHEQFEQVAEIIREGRRKAYSAIDTVLMDTYWNVGKYVSQKIESAQWGESIVVSLSAYLSEHLPDIKGFSEKNLWRMRQFFDLYKGYAKLSALLRVLSWTNNMLIMSKCRTMEEREFYLNLAAKDPYSSRELERAINSAMFERSISSAPKLSAALRVLHQNISNILRDSYSLDFLGLPDNHSEYDLRKGIVCSLKNFIIEFGRDFAFLHNQAAGQAAFTE